MWKLSIHFLNAGLVVLRVISVSWRYRLPGAYDSQWIPFATYGA
jgi:hypothetical protein